ncbi:hypothetical protein RhiirA4_451099 [Rhizophagus irregularis]|uniref:HMG box domain-containing protein n=1 Tax=Rhizophagus irregularis TaxID=588596 RepID=A0A2I1FUU7_9GLOM|nr:hypothetical protein RhiirA4_451099 [Rhizophagus irregularis]
MDEAARKKYCRLLMFDVPPPSNHFKGSLNTVPPPSIIPKGETSIHLITNKKTSTSTVNRENPKTSKCFHFISTKQLLITANISNAKISKLLAKMWRNETEEEKLYWKKNCG